MKKEYDQLETIRNIRRHVNKKTEHNESSQKNEKENMTVEHQTNFHGKCKSPYSFESDEALALYVSAILIGTIFVDRVLIWIAATVIYMGFKFKK